MDLPYAEVIETLEAKGLTQIHHANSVLTSTQFLRHGSLLSRGTIQRKGFFQTEQGSDEVDVKYSLWFDVFADSVDIHERANRANLYGPVLFVLSLAALKKAFRGRLWVTKLNPTKWNGVPEDDRWFRSIEELKAGFKVGRFDQMIVFRHSGGELPIKSCLSKIILDDPQLTVDFDDGKKADIYTMAYGALLISMTEGGISVEIERRVCRDSCKCRDKYGEDRAFTAKMFLPTCL